jgi:death-on-curing protein
MKPEDVQYLTVGDVLDLHDAALSETGGMGGVLKAAELDAAVMGPRASYGGIPLLVSIADIAAAYGFYLVKLHPFNDGNKRTALLSMAAFLERHQMPLKLTKKWVTVMVDVAETHDFQREQLAELIAESVGWGELDIKDQ